MSLDAHSDAYLLPEGACLIAKCWPAPGNFLGARRITPTAISGTWVGPSRFIGGLLAGQFSPVDFQSQWVDRIVDLPGLLKDLQDSEVHEGLMREVFAYLHKQGEGGTGVSWFFSNGKGQSMYLEMCAALRNRLLALQSLEGQLAPEHFARFDTDLLYLGRVVKLFHWYSAHKEALANIHYGPWAVSPGAKFARFLDCVVAFQEQHTSSTPLPAVTGPLWWTFREFFKEEFHVDLEADLKLEDPGRQTPQKSTIPYPPQYPLWSGAQRVVWDINNGHHRMSAAAKARVADLGRPVVAEDLPFIFGSET